MNSVQAIGILLLVLQINFIKSNANPIEEYNNKCQCSLSFDYKPTCGSNGRTYPSPSAIECENKCYGKSIIKSYPGECIAFRYPSIIPIYPTIHPTIFLQ